jgi:hypothetical protein
MRQIIKVNLLSSSKLYHLCIRYDGKWQKPLALHLASMMLLWYGTGNPKGK